MNNDQMIDMIASFVIFTCAMCLLIIAIARVT